MLKPTRRWRIPTLDTDEIQRIAETNHIHPLIAKILVQRGIKSKEEIERFFHADVTGFHDPLLLDGMKKAVARIQSAIIKNEKILIYGDYDADGISSTTLLFKVLSTLKADFSFYIPNRFTEGYGLNKEAILQAANDGCQLIVTVDTGISAIEEAGFAKELGITLIITDHHEPPAVLPDAYAIINPKKPGDPYPFKQLAGVGVAFKLAHALLGRIPLEYIDIAAVGTIADLVPVIDENRIIVKMGLQQMKQTKHIGLKVLLEKAGLLGKEITAGHIGYIIGPRINASGRLDTAEHAVRLFLSEDEETAKGLTETLEEINLERQALVEQITKEVLSVINTQQMEHDKVLIVAGEGWNVGVIGIVASKILETYYRPTIILSIDPETKMAKGSARSIDGYDIYQALTEVKALLLNFGGHPAAAGLTIKKADIPQLRTRLNQLAEQWLDEEDFIPIERVDASCSIHEVDIDLIKQIEQMAPFGIGNPTPTILMEQTTVKQIVPMGKNKQHLKLHLWDQKKTLDAVLFKKGELKKDIAPHSTIYLVGELAINEWNGQQKPQMIVKDLQIPSVQVFDWRNERNKKGLLKEIVSNQTMVLYDPSVMEMEQGNLGWFTAYQQWEKVKPRERQIDSLVLYTLPSSVQQMEQILKANPQLNKIYCLYENNVKTYGIVDRTLYKKVYAVLKQKNEPLSRRETERFFKSLGIHSEIIQFILDVFHELGFIIIEGDKIVLDSKPEKKALHQSMLYQKALEQEKSKQVFLQTDHQQLKRWFIEQMGNLSERKEEEKTEWILKS